MKLKYFAWVRERIGKAEETVEPPPSVQTIEQLIGWLAARGETYAHAFEAPRPASQAIRSSMVLTAGGGSIVSSGLPIRSRTQAKYFSFIPHPP